TAFAAGSSAGGVVDPKAAVLAEGALRSALVSKLKLAVVLWGMIAAGIGVGSAAREGQTGAAAAGGPHAIAAESDSPQRRPPVPAAQEPGPDRGEIRGVALLPQDNKVPQGLARWRHHAALAAHQKAARTLAFSPDGGRVASGGDDGCVRIWDVTTAKESLTLRGPNARPV